MLHQHEPLDVQTRCLRRTNDSSVEARNEALVITKAMLAQSGDITFAKEIILLTSVVMACLLISPIRMFALKFKGFGWSGNELRYSFIVACVVLIAAFTKYAIPSIILIYIVISTLRWLISSRKA
jgi:CDP-diacylglycerol--serine O-phosphatidyltransferase